MLCCHILQCFTKNIEPDKSVSVPQGSSQSNILEALEGYLQEFHNKYNTESSSRKYPSQTFFFIVFNPCRMEEAKCAQVPTSPRHRQQNGHAGLWQDDIHLFTINDSGCPAKQHSNQGSGSHITYYSCTSLCHNKK